jgi:hypothetical protein
MAQAKDDHIPLSEPFCTQDLFATELGSVEVIGPCVRLTFVVRQNATFGGGKERLVVAKLVLPAEAVRQMSIDVPALLGGAEVIQKPELRSDLN